MPAKESKKTRQLKEKLILEPKRVWDTLSAPEKRRAFRYADGYRDFLNHVRTERGAVAYFIGKAVYDGFVKLQGRTNKGTRVYQVLHGKLMALAVVGTRPPTE